MAHFFRRVCNILQVHNVFTITYHPQTNGQVERFNRTVAAMLRCYVEDNPGFWCLYAPALCYAYNMSVHSTTGTTPFDLVLSRPPLEFTRDHRPQSRARTVRAQKSDYLRRLHVSLQKASRSLKRAQARYKRDLDRDIRATRRIETGDHIFLDTHDCVAKRPKLTDNISGPFRVLGHNSNTIVIQRGEVVERVSRDRVTLAPKQATMRAARIEDAQPEHLQEKRTSGRSYTFSKILGHRELQSGDLEFKISWDGNYKPTWEPRDCVPEEEISRYFARYRRELKHAPVVPAPQLRHQWRELNTRHRSPQPEASRSRRAPTARQTSTSNGLTHNAQPHSTITPHELSSIDSTGARPRAPRFKAITVEAHTTRAPTPGDNLCHNDRKALTSSA